MPGRDRPGRTDGKGMGGACRRMAALLFVPALILLLTACGILRQPERPLLGVGDLGLPDEGSRLVICTSHKEEVWRPIVKEFEERTGIWVEVVTGGTNELLQRIGKEKDAPHADVMFGGGVESLQSRAELFSPWYPGEELPIDPELRSENGLWTPFSALPTVLIYNTKLVEPDELTSWEDLYSPRFRGRIAFADPEVSGSAFTALITLRNVDGSTESAFTRFSDALDGVQLPGSGDVMTAVESGSALVGITLEETALKRIAAGESLAIVYPSEGTTAIPDGTALIKNAPHRAAAEKFLAFTVSRDVQSLLPARFYRRPVRTDVAGPEGLPALSEIGTVPYDVKQVSEMQPVFLSEWRYYRNGGERP